jgi:Tfp pilus assembly pilus retraction ATPase PilT
MAVNWEKIIKILKHAIKIEASDIYIRENRQITLKDAKWTILINETINLDEFKELLRFILWETDKFDAAMLKVKNLWRYLFWCTINWVFDVTDAELKDEKDWIRVRWQLVKDDGGLFLTLRLFLNKYIDYSDLTKYSNIWNILENVFKIKQGLIIIVWWTWQWKSTLVSAYLEKLIRDKSHKFLKTIEDPIEHIFEDTKVTKSQRWTMISQIEIWKHVESYEEAILSCTRDNSDIVYIQEIASKESAIALKKVTNSWKLVIITLHAAKVTQAISRLLVLMREFDWDDDFNKRLLAQESICIIWQNLITGNVLDENWQKIQWKDWTYIQKKYWIQELLNIWPTERNYIIDTSKDTDFERSLTKSLNDPSKSNVALNNVLIDFYKKGIIDAPTLIARTNDIANWKASIETERYDELKHIEDFSYIEWFIIDKKRQKYS